MFSGSFLFGLVLLLLMAGPVFALIWLRWSFLTAQPDEWLLRIRDGKMVKAGIGISTWRRPGDLVVRFSSTIQRAGFKVDALTRERLHALVEGFVLWSVSPAGNDPFTAFSKLGLANLNDPPKDLLSKKHLYTKPQYFAFQGVIAADVQSYVATSSLDELMLNQDKFVAELNERLQKSSAQKGIRIEEIQLLQVQPADPAVLRELSTAYDQQTREDAAQIRLQTAERMKKREIESATNLAKEESNAHRDTKAHSAQVELELEQRRAELLDAQNHVKRQQLEHEGELKMEQLEIERKTKLRVQEIERERQLAAEAAQQELTEARIQREEAEAKAKRALMLEAAETERDIILAVSSAEEKRPQAVRDYELARLATEKVSEALGALPIKDARWVTIGNESPLATIAAAIGEVRNLFSENSTPTKPSGGKAA
jgi:flotillin